MPTSEVDSIFERNRRGYSASPGGAGFGLAIGRAVAAAHDGQVRVVPNEPSGARFEVLLPLAGPRGLGQ